MNRLHVQSQGYRKSHNATKLEAARNSLSHYMFDFELIFDHCVQKSFTIANFLNLHIQLYGLHVYHDPELKKLGYLLSKTFLQINSRAGTLLSAFCTLTPLVFPGLAWGSVVPPFLVPHCNPLGVHTIGHLSIRLLPVCHF